MFVKKTQTELKAMSETEVEAYFTAKAENDLAVQNKAIADALDPIKNELATAKEDLQQAGLKITELEQKGISSTAKPFSEEIKENVETLKAIAGGSNKEVVLKAISNRASIANNQQAYDLVEVGQLATRKLSLYDIFPKVKISESNNNGTIRYYDWDEDTIVRAAASVAEGVAFPESTAKFKKGSVTIEKIGDSLPVTEEFFEDEQMFASELELFLQTNVNLVVDTQLCNGTGASNTLVGLYQSANAYTPVASGITDPNIFDLIVKVAESITVVGGSKYNPDTVIARRSVINQMKLKKDNTNNYILPSFVSADGKIIDGLQVIESNVAPVNTLIVCDKRFAKIYEKSGVVVSKGEVNAQFIEDAMTIKARKRLAFLIRNADKGAFAKVTSISAALVTLAS